MAEFHASGSLSPNPITTSESYDFNDCTNDANREKGVNGMKPGT